MATHAEILAALDGMTERLKGDEMKERLGSFSKKLQFEVKDIGESFLLEVADGVVAAVRSGGDETPDIRVSADGDTLVGILQGEINAMSAFMGGKIQVDAPLPDLLKLQQILQ
jgi:putative sterol carrier protein